MTRTLKARYHYTSQSERRHARHMERKLFLEIQRAMRALVRSLEPFVTIVDEFMNTGNYTDLINALGGHDRPGWEPPEDWGAPGEPWP